MYLKRTGELNNDFIKANDNKLTKYQEDLEMELGEIIEVKLIRTTKKSSFQLR